jgi:hypothetical protein
LRVWQHSNTSIIAMPPSTPNTPQRKQGQQEEAGGRGRAKVGGVHMRID